MTPFPTRRILVPVDFSALSRAAWNWARAFGGADGRLEALFVHEAVPTALMGLPPAGFLTPAAKRKLARRLSEEYPGCRARVEEGPVIPAILRRARQADLVVMGSSGRHGLELVVNGSVSEAVVRASPVPVLAVKAGCHPIRSIVAPMCVERYARRGLRTAAEAAARFDAGLTVLHVQPDRNDVGNARFFLSGMLERLPASLRREPPPVVLLERGETLPTILREARNFDLVVLTAHRKSLLGDVVLGTTAERVLRHSRVPVLAVPSGREITLF